MINNLDSENETGGLLQLFLAIVSIVVILGAWLFLSSIHI